MDPSDAIPRARAAWAYSRREQKDIAERSGLNYSRVKAILTGDKRIKDVAIEELWALADAADVPRAFMEVGFEALALTDTDRRVIELDRRIKELESRDQAQALADELAGRLESEGVASNEETRAIIRAAHLALAALAHPAGSGSTPDATDATPESARARDEESRRTGRQRAS